MFRGGSGSRAKPSPRSALWIESRFPLRTRHQQPLRRRRKPRPISLPALTLTSAVRGEMHPGPQRSIDTVVSAGRSPGRCTPFLLGES